MHLSADQIEAIKQKAGHLSRVPTAMRRHGLVLRPQCGFTLTELITVIVILGIISAVAVPRFFDVTVFQSRGAADQVRAALRYGQKVAIAQHRNVNVTISSGATSDCGAVLVAGNVNCVISDSVTVPARTVTFDRGGRPVPNAADSIVVGTGPNSTTITIAAETGYVR
jgi:MSHA pilin protein MshC